MEISLRSHNNTYAPGIATYGIDGKTGQQGDPGTSMFFSAYSFTDPNLFTTFAEKITSRMLPIIVEDILLNRKYVNGDLFVSPSGTIFRLKDINQLSIDSKNGTIGNAYSYFYEVGKFRDDTEPFDDYNNTTIREKQITIKESAGTTGSGSGLLNLIRNANDSSCCDFMNIQALYNTDADINLDIKYEPKYNAFVFDSKYPIIFNGNLYVNNTIVDSNISGFSPITTTDNSITKFMGYCKLVNYTLDSSIYEYTKEDSSTIYFGSVYTIKFLSDGLSLDNIFDSSTMIHFQNKDHQDFQVYRDSQSIYYFKQDYDYVKKNDLINRINYTDINDIQVSAIKDIEIYLKKNKE